VIRRLFIEHRLAASARCISQTARLFNKADAMVLCESLQLPGAEYSRGYIQSWLRGDVIPEKSAMRIFEAADRILKAGQAK
jgi:hypothetical protein